MVKRIQVSNQLNDDPYRDWYLVYRAEVTDRIKHWPMNRKHDAEANGEGDFNFERIMR